jgi:hypothetical protein
VITTHLTRIASTALLAVDIFVNQQDGELDT